MSVSKIYPPELEMIRCKQKIKAIDDMFTIITKKLTSALFTFQAAMPEVRKLLGADLDRVKFKEGLIII